MTPNSIVNLHLRHLLTQCYKTGTPLFKNNIQHNWYLKKIEPRKKAPNLIDMAPFLVEYAGLKYLTKFLIVRVNNTNVVSWTHF